MIFLLAQSDGRLAIQYTDKLFVVGDAVKHLSGDRVGTGDILHSFILLTFLAALLCQDCHHSGSVDVLHAHYLQSLRGQLLVLGRGKELIEILNFAYKHFRRQLLVLEFLDKHRFIESPSFNNDVVSFLSLDKEAILSDLEKSLNEVFCNFL